MHELILVPVFHEAAVRAAQTRTEWKAVQEAAWRGAAVTEPTGSVPARVVFQCKAN